MSGERDNPYELLGVDPTATPEQLRRAFRRRVVVWHRAQVLGIVDRIAVLKRAYETLKDPVRRREYDRLLRDPFNSVAPSAADPDDRYAREVKLRTRMAREISVRASALGADAVRANAATMRLLASEHEQRERDAAERLARRALRDRIAQGLLVGLLFAALSFFVLRLFGRG